MSVNCCNGRVGKRLLDLASQDDKFRQFVVPTGVEIVKAIGDLGADVSEALNCCNGRVGQRLATKDIATALSGAGED